MDSRPSPDESCRTSEGGRPTTEVEDPRTITGPDPALLRYYFLSSLLALVFFPFVFLPLYFKYRTLRYRFDEEGVSLSYGLLFQRETYLNYRRIQDIQMSRGVLQRRLGLADLELQTASGSSGAEMKIEGVRSPERLRDFLYERMRGAADAADDPDDPPDRRREAVVPDEVLALLEEIRGEVRALNRTLAARLERGGPG